MANRKILIITHSKDNPCVEHVMGFITASGAEAIRFNVDHYPLTISLSTIFDQNQWQVLLDDGAARTDLADVTAVWFRRSYNIGSGLPDILEPQFLNPTIGELRRTLFGMLDGLSCFQMERFSTYRRLDSKEEQLRKAVRHGLKVPDTCISNDPQEVKKFAAKLNGPMITKMQTSFTIYKEKEEQVVFTTELEPAHLEEMDGLKYCPMIFQERVKKELELRVTVVGTKVFAFSIDSQRVSNAQVDWRKEGVALIDDWQPYELPAAIEKKLLAFMDDYKLNYGAADFILTPQGDYYFLEVNAAGEYFWLDRLCNYGISRQIAAVLLGDAARRE